VNWGYMVCKWLAIGTIAAIAAAVTDITAMQAWWGAIALSVMDCARDLLKKAFGLI